MENVLTSSACPAPCDGKVPCVLYSPSQQAQCRETPAASPCLSGNAFELPNVTAPCNVTYQCLNALVDTNTWSLALTPSFGVTQVLQLTYPPSGVVTVRHTGGLGRNARGEVENVTLDGSLFNTPASVESFSVSELNLQSVIETVDFAKRSWKDVAFTNCNLAKVPTGFTTLALHTVTLSKNVISAISDPTPFRTVTSLNLSYNNLQDLTIALPAITTLDLSGNPLTKIPDAIFSMTTLTDLHMRQCNLTNIQLSDAQYTFLAQRQTLNVDFTVTSCAKGYAQRKLANSDGSVCVVASETPATTSPSGSNHTVLIVGVVAGVVVVMAAAVVVLVQRMSSPDHITDESMNNDDRVADVGWVRWYDPDLLPVSIEYRDVELVKLLSRGGFGEVWLGLYMNENVAIKRLTSENRTFKNALAFVEEIKIMARLDHPKVVRFIGVAWTIPVNIQAVAEFMDCGDLRSLLDSSRASSLTWANLKCQIAIDIADALVYLHTLNPKLIRRDLKSRNVLIDANTGAKLSDFGISRNRSVEETMTAGVGTSRWMAPEVILGGHYTEFADIYSFGVVLSELDTAKTPFHDAVNTNGAKMPDVTILQLVSAGKLQPSFEATCPESIVKLARACLSFDPAQRPSAIHISYELRKIMKDEL